MSEKELSAEGIQLAEIRTAKEQMMALWIKEAERGDKLDDFYKSGHYNTLNREILEPLEREAFNTIKAPEFNPSDVNLVYQLRALCQIIDKIRERVQTVIGDGVAAKLRISEYNSTPKEGE